MDEAIAFRKKKLNIRNIIKESQELVHGLKFPIFWRTILFLSAKVFISFLTISLLFSTILLPLSSRYKLLAMGFMIVLLSYIAWFLYISAMVLGIRQSIGLPLSEKLVRTHFKKNQK